MPVLILKFDDLREPTDSWDAVIGICKKYNIKASMGVIGNYLDGENEELFKWIKSWHNAGIFELWNHGYTHAKYKEGFEFLGRTEEDQYLSLEKTQILAKEKLGITISTFGAPWNKTDGNTIKALNRIPEIKVWLHGDKRCKSKICLRRSRIFCEYRTDKNEIAVDFERFKTKYEEAVTHEKYSVVQFHPRVWDRLSIERFENIAKFLIKEQGVKFMLPKHFFFLKDKMPPP